MKCPKLIVSLALVLTLSSCVGAVVGVAVDTTAAVVKAPFQLASAVVGVAADTTGTVIAAPFRMANAAVGGTRHGDQDHKRPHRHHGSAHQDGQPGHQHLHSQAADEAHGYANEH
mgnify:CR=1 FL=1